MNFPNPFTPDYSTRAGRMMACGRVKVTVVNSETEQHITVLLKAFADNRNREFKPDVHRNWVESYLEDATHIFVEVPRPSGEWNDKIGTYYPKSGKWFEADNADPQRVRAAMIVANWVANPNYLDTQGAAGLKVSRISEASECGICGLELTDPVSQQRGVGPTCYGKVTESEHQIKGLTPTAQEIAGHEAHSPGADSLTYVPEATEEDVKEWRDVNAKKEIDFEELGIADAAVNALYHLAKGLDENQLEDLNEWVHDRLAAVRTERRRYVADALETGEVVEETKTTDRAFMAR